MNEAYDIAILNTMDEGLAPNREGVEWLIELGRVKNPGALDLTADDVIDTSIVDELVESGFISGLGEK